MSGAVCIAAYVQMFILLRLHVDRRHSSVNTPPQTKYKTEEINFNIYRITVVQSHATDSGQYKPPAESQTLLTLSQPLKVVQTLIRKESVKILIIDRISNYLINVCFFRPNLGVLIHSYLQ